MYYQQIGMMKIVVKELADGIKKADDWKEIIIVGKVVAKVGDAIGELKQVEKIINEEKKNQKG